jgi:hypothetical protein
MLHYIGVKSKTAESVIGPKDGATPISANLSRMFFVNTPQTRHPERSASQIDCVTQFLWRGAEEPVPNVAEGTSAVLILPVLFGAFRQPKPDNRWCDTHLMVTGTSFHVL